MKSRRAAAAEPILKAEIHGAGRVDTCAYKPLCASAVKTAMAAMEMYTGMTAVEGGVGVMRGKMKVRRESAVRESGIVGGGGGRKVASVPTRRKGVV